MCVCVCVSVSVCMSMCRCVYVCMYNHLYSYHKCIYFKINPYRGISAFMQAYTLYRLVIVKLGVMGN